MLWNGRTTFSVSKRLKRGLLRKGRHSGMLPGSGGIKATCSVTQATSQPEALLRTVRFMPEGTIKKLTDKGFGFIALPGGKDIFFHSTGLEGVQYENLHEGQKGFLRGGAWPKGSRAEQVKPVLTSI